MKYAYKINESATNHSQQNRITWRVFFPNYREERVAADNNHFNWVIYWHERVSLATLHLEDSVFLAVAMFEWCFFMHAFCLFVPGKNSLVLFF